MATFADSDRSRFRAYGLLILAALFFLVFWAATAKAQDAPKEINFGIISTESSQNLRKIWEPFIADMEKRTGLKINPFFATDYAGIIEGMRFNKVQLAWYGNKAGMEAVDRAGGEVFMRTVNYDGSEGYYSVLIVHRDSPLNSVEDVLKNSKNLVFGNGDPNSTSGFLVPSYYVFALNDVDPRTAFKRTLNANHEANALSVANKQVDVATNNTENLDRLAVTFPEKREVIKVVWTSPLIPTDPLVWRADLDLGTKKVLEDFFLTYGGPGPDQEREAAILKDLLWKGFKKSDNDQLIPIRQLELFKAKKKIADDEGLEQAEKDRQTADIDRKLAELDAQSARQ